MDWNIEKWDFEAYQKLLTWLEANRDPKFLEFHSKLVPGKEMILGIRLPILRGIAKEISKGDSISFLQIVGHSYYEEVMLHGFVIGNMRVKEYGLESILDYVTGVVPLIDNWAICDSFCASLKVTKKNKQTIFEFLHPYIKSEEPFEVRFALVMLLDYYIEGEYLQEIFSICDMTHPDHYYVQMAKAWLISICFIKYEKETLEYLQTCQLDDFTYNKSLSKITESLRVPAEKKQFIRSLKR